MSNVSAGRTSNGAQAKPQRIAAYIRVSTEEAASNPEGSIKSQEQRIRKYVELKNMETNFGEIAGVYTDPARSGKDTRRPELQRMLNDIRRGEITMIMVTELSRLSRSIKDFSEIWELMRAHGCQFHSLREQFDTSTAAGEMVLYVVANISQFERKQCSERIAANFQARAERGLFNGGAVPFGYQLDPDRKGYLNVNAEDAALVREIFATFLKEGCLSLAGKSLNARGYRLKRRREGGGGHPRLGHFTVETVYGMLTNEAYCGVRVYYAQGERHTCRACWEPIIDADTFQRVKTKLKSNRYRFKSPSAKRFPYMLSGMAFCGTCGDRLTGKSAHGNGGKIAYYEHGWATKRQGCLNKPVFACEPHRVLAKLLEPAVWGEVLKMLSDPTLAASLIDEAHRTHAAQSHVTEADRLRRRAQGINEQIDALAEHLTQIPKGVSPAPIFTQMHRLEMLKVDAQKELNEIGRAGGSTDFPASFRDYQSYLKFVRVLLNEAGTPEIRAKIVQKLVQKVEVLPQGFRIHYYVGKGQIVPTDWRTEESGAKDPGPSGPKVHESLGLFSFPKTDSENFLIPGSKSLITEF